MDKEDERADLLRMRAMIEQELERIGDLLYLWGPHDDDTEFTDYVKKATYYRDILKRIERDLKNLDNDR
jgi:hypothetical protein